MVKKREENEHGTFNLWSKYDLAYSIDNLIELLWVESLFSTKAPEYRALSKHSICLKLQVPCFPDNKTGLILIFTPKFGTRAYFRGCIILIYQQMKLQSKNYEILNKQKLRKKIYIYLPLTCFLFRNSLTTIYSRTIISSSSGMSCKSSVSKIAAEFSLSGTSISRRIFGPTLSCRAIEVWWNAKFLSRYPA